MKTVLVNTQSKSKILSALACTCSLVILDDQFKPVTVSQSNNELINVIMWMDHRSKQQADFINSTKTFSFKKRWWFNIIGNGSTENTVVKTKFKWKLHFNLFLVCWNFKNQFWVLWRRLCKFSLPCFCQLILVYLLQCVLLLIYYPN